MEQNLSLWNAVCCKPWEPCPSARTWFPWGKSLLWSLLLFKSLSNFNQIIQHSLTLCKEGAAAMAASSLVRIRTCSENAKNFPLKVWKKEMTPWLWHDIMNNYHWDSGNVSNISSCMQRESNLLQPNIITSLSQNVSRDTAPLLSSD